MTYWDELKAKGGTVEALVTGLKGVLRDAWPKGECNHPRCAGRAPGARTSGPSSRTGRSGYTAGSWSRWWCRVRVRRGDDSCRRLVVGTLRRRGRRSRRGWADETPVQTLPPRKRHQLLPPRERWPVGITVPGLSAIPHGFGAEWRGWTRMGGLRDQLQGGEDRADGLVVGHRAGSVLHHSGTADYAIEACSSLTAEYFGPGCAVRRAQRSGTPEPAIVEALEAVWNIVKISRLPMPRIFWCASGAAGRP